MVGPVLHLRTQGAEESSISVIYESVTKHPTTQCLETMMIFRFLTMWACGLTWDHSAKGSAGAGRLLTRVSGSCC